VHFAWDTCVEERNARTVRLLRTKLYIPRAHPDRVERP